MMECPYCLGTGFVMELDGDGYGGEVECIECNGTGRIYDPDSPDKERI